MTTGSSSAAYRCSTDATSLVGVAYLRDLAGQLADGLAERVGGLAGPLSPRVGPVQRLQRVLEIGELPALRPESGGQVGHAGRIGQR